MQKSRDFGTMIDHSKLLRSEQKVNAWYLGLIKLKLYKIIVTFDLEPKQNHCINVSD